MKKVMIVAMAVALAACQQEEKAADAAAQDATGAAKAVQEAATDAKDKVAAAVSSGDLNTEEKKVSYAIGLRYGEGMSRELKELDLSAFYSGLTDGFKGNKPALEADDMMATLQAFQTRKMQEMQEAQNKAATENKTASEKFLSENKTAEGVKTTESGLQYQIITEGPKDGASPDENDKVKVHYHGTLVDGTVFDSSVDRGEPIEFAVNGVIKGWTEALQLMSKGDKYKIFIPSELAYGERGAGPKIGPNSALVFEVELLDVMPQENK